MPVVEEDGQYTPRITIRIEDPSYHGTYAGSQAMLTITLWGAMAVRHAARLQPGHWLLATRLQAVRQTPDPHLPQANPDAEPTHVVHASDALGTSIHNLSCCHALLNLDGALYAHLSDPPCASHDRMALFQCMLVGWHVPSKNLWDILCAYRKHISVKQRVPDHRGTKGVTARRRFCHALSRGGDGH